ncbi:chemotaxis protein [Desulfovibrio sp. OttesenSCG-928-F20]|nr:chemotaxis protein [Desulfovibrio sp. OttesenSCG-928-F20]
MDSSNAAVANDLEIIEFFVDQETDGGVYRSYYGMNVAKVLEIIRMPLVTGVPGKHHPAALGTFNLRGKVLPLVDLARWLGINGVQNDSLKVIVSEFSGVVTAFIVTGVTRIHRMNWNQVEPPGKHLQAFSQDSLTGVVRFEDRIVFLLDMEHIIASMDSSTNLQSYVQKDESNEGAGYHVLVADDSPSIRNVIALCLEKAHFSVTRVTCGREAWEQLKAWEKEAQSSGQPLSNFVNLVISDIEMPEMDGHTLTRMIKNEAAFKNIPVILFSSLISKVVREKGDQAGADDQISKPDLPKLASRTLELIRKAQKN